MQLGETMHVLPIVCLCQFYMRWELNYFEKLDSRSVYICTNYANEGPALTMNTNSEHEEATFITKGA